MSDWNLKISEQKNNMAHGIKFFMWERFADNCRGESALGTKKLHLDGKVSLTIAQGQHKYGDELIAQVYSEEQVKIYDRRASGYNRVQIYFGKIDEATAEMLEKVALTIRNIIAQKTEETDSHE